MGRRPLKTLQTSSDKPIAQLTGIFRDRSFPMKITIPFVLAGALLLMAGPACGAEVSMPVLVLNDTNEPPHTTAAGQGVLDIVAGEAFRRAGIQLRLVKLPAARGLISANTGIEAETLRAIKAEGLFDRLYREQRRSITVAATI